MYGGVLDRNISHTLSTDSSRTSAISTSLNVNFGNSAVTVIGENGHSEKVNQSSNRGMESVAGVGCAIKFNGRTPTMNLDGSRLTTVQNLVDMSTQINEASPGIQFSGPFQILTATYSNVEVYEAEINDITVMRRIGDSYVNATQMLELTGLPEEERTRILKGLLEENGVENIETGHIRYRGVWVPFQQGEELCRRYDIWEILRPLLTFKKMEKTNGDNGCCDSEQGVEEKTLSSWREGYQFQYETKGEDGQIKVVKVQHCGSATEKESVIGIDEEAMEANANQELDVCKEPLRKRACVKTKYTQGGSGSASRASSSMKMEEKGNESLEAGDIESAMIVPVSLPPLPGPKDKESKDKQAMLLDLFGEMDWGGDYTKHAALTRLSGSDFEIPLDDSGNTALHWAATLARIPILRMMIEKGANIFRGNAAGQSALMSAVTVNNCLEHDCFAELLVILDELIEVRDSQGRTVLHHIAVSSGVKGRSASSKYYLEVLLEHLVENSRNGGGGMDLERFMKEMVNARDKAGNTALNLVARIGNRSITRQLLEVKADPSIPNYKGIRSTDFGIGLEGEIGIEGFGKSASNGNGIANKSRDSGGGRFEDGNREIVPTLNSYFSQTDNQFNAELRYKQEQIDQTNNRIRELSAQQRIEEARLAELRHVQRKHSQRTLRIVNILCALEEQRGRFRSGDLATATAGSTTVTGFDSNKSEIIEQVKNNQTITGKIKIGDADDFTNVRCVIMDLIARGGIQINEPLNEEQKGKSTTTAVMEQGTIWIEREKMHDTPSLKVSREALDDLREKLPTVRELKIILSVYQKNNEELTRRAVHLKARDAELESKYRRVVSLCTGLEEAKVDSMLNGLVAAVESEAELVEVARVRDFLRKVDGVVE